MNIGLSAITESSGFNEAVIRLAEPLRLIRESSTEISTVEESFDDLLVVIMDDEPESYIKICGAPGESRLYQILAGLPGNLTFKPQDDTELIAAIVKQLLKAIAVSSLSREAKLEAISRVRGVTVFDDIVVGRLPGIDSLPAIPIELLELMSQVTLAPEGSDPGGEVFIEISCPETVVIERDDVENAVLEDLGDDGDVTGSGRGMGIWNLDVDFDIEISASAALQRIARVLDQLGIADQCRLHAAHTDEWRTATDYLAG